MIDAYGLNQIQNCNVQFSMAGNHPYHKSCYKELYHPKCDVCKEFVSVDII